MLQDFFIPFVAVGLAELGDKTQIAVFCLASKTKKYIQLLTGVILAFIITDGLAILLGDFITGFVPIKYIKLASAAIFIVFGIITLLGSREEESKCELKNPFISGFSMIFLSEMGDKTQIASGLFATQYNPVIVFFGVIFALALLSCLAVFLGKFILAKLNRRTVSYIAGGLFLVIGVFLLF